MQLEDILKTMTPTIHKALKRAIEIGKWPDGKPLTDEQKAICMEAVIAYDASYLNEEDRVGYIDRGSKQEGEQCGDEPESDITNIKWLQ